MRRVKDLSLDTLGISMISKYFEGTVWLGLASNLGLIAPARAHLALLDVVVELVGVDEIEDTLRLMLSCGH